MGMAEAGPWLCRMLGFLAVIALAMPSPAGAQAGSTGGSIGKQGKSVSGGADAPARGSVNRAPPANSKPHQRGTLSQPKGPACAHVVGLWDSWASFVFGASDTTFKSDGTWMHAGSGVGGKWWCEGSEFRIQKPGSGIERYRFSEDRRKIIGIDSNSVTFSRK
jgi:hypothetical protein